MCFRPLPAYAAFSVVSVGNLLLTFLICMSKSGSLRPRREQGESWNTCRSHVTGATPLRPDQVGLTRVNNPDKDMQPTGQFEIYNASETMSAGYSPEGAFLGSMRSKRIESLLRAYPNTTSSELYDFPPAVAKLIAGYKDGSKSGTHTVAYKNCCTAPPSLTCALISALGAATELFATPLDFNPKMKHYSAPFAEDGEFGTHADAFSFIWQSSCYCHPEPTDAQMLKTLRWALACASIQTEPLLVTLLLPERPKSAFTSLLSQPSVLHLTTVQNITSLNPTSWSWRPS